MDRGFTPKQFFYFKIDALRNLCIHTGLISPNKNLKPTKEVIDKRISEYNGITFMVLSIIVLFDKKSTEINRLAAGIILEIFWPNWKKELGVEIVGCAIERRDHEVYAWKRDVLNRDNRICQKCGDTKRVEAHHIIRWVDEPRLRIDRNNGIALCHRCHNTEHGKACYD